MALALTLTLTGATLNEPLLLFYLIRGKATNDFGSESELRKIETETVEKIYLYHREKETNN